MLIFPIGQEDSTVRRLPWVTFVIMALCLFAYIITSNANKQDRDEVVQIMTELSEYYLNHPYLELEPEIKKLMFPTEDMYDLFQQSANSFGYKPPEDPEQLAQEQSQLDALAHQAIETLSNTSFRKWGLIPDDISLSDLITYMFMHGGWIHLFSNLFILFLSGPFIEDVWGRTAYLGFYLIAGVFSALMFSLHYPDSTIPLIGASGAISGVMGAFLIRFWKRRIKFFYWFMFVFAGTFLAPVWVILPLWFINEVINARVMDNLGFEGGGVAHWAHIWGFVFGIVTGVGMKFFNIEEKYINPKIEAQITLVDNTIIDQAMELRENGRKKEAFYMLRDVARRDPQNFDVIIMLWNISLEIGKEREAKPIFTKMIQEEMKSGQYELALTHYNQLRMNIPDAVISNHITLKIIEYMIRENAFLDAEDLMRELLLQVDSDTPSGLMVRMVNVAEALDKKIMAKTLEKAIAHPDIPQEKKEEYEAALKSLTEASEPDESDIYTYSSVGKISEKVEEAKEVETETVPKTLLVRSAVPVAFKRDKMLLDVDKLGRKVFSFDKIKVISIVRIRPANQRPFLVMDFLMDELHGEHEKIRIIRIHCNKFNPQTFVPNAKNPMHAFRILVAGILKLSGATPYPNSEIAAGKSFEDFPSIEVYEQRLSG